MNIYAGIEKMQLKGEYNLRMSLNCSDIWSVWIFILFTAPSFFEGKAILLYTMDI